MAVAQKSTASLQKILRNSNFSRMMSSGQGSGRSEGAIREAGGSFGKKEKAEEDQYFRRQEREQLERMKKVEAEEKAKKKQDGKK